MVSTWLRSKSIGYKTWLLFALSIISAVSIFLIARHEILNTMMVVRLDEYGNELKQKSARVTGIFQSLADDIRYLSISGPVKELASRLGDPSADPEQLRLQVTNEFVAMIKSKRRYHQLRIISVADGGHEVVRITRMLDGSINIADEKHLQQKGDTPYFKAASHLRAGEIYISPIELNREDGKVETPHRPVVRAAMPLQDATGKTSAIIVGNMDFGDILNWISDSSEHGRDYVTNVDGDYLVHPDRKKVFGFEFNRRYRFQHDYPELEELISRRSLGSKNNIYTYLNGDIGVAAIRTRFDPHTTANDILMIRVIPHETIAAQAASTISQTMWLILLLILLAALLARWFIHVLVSPIRTLAKAASAISSDEARKIPDFGFGGEIADLANDFNAVLEKLDLQQLKLIDSLSWNELLMNAAPDAIITIDEKGKIHSFNSAAEEIFGYKADEIRGKNINILMPESYARQHDNHLTRYMLPENRSALSMERKLEGKRKDDSTFPMEIRVTEARFENKVRFVGILRDITEKERAKEELRHEHEFNQQLLAAIPSILIGVNREGLVTLWNHSAATTFGIDSSRALNTHFSELEIQWNREMIDRGIADSRAMGPARIDNVAFRRPDGSEGILGLTINTIYEKGLDNGFLLLGSDVTERLKLEGQLQLAQKMEAVGELAAGIAHEINTPLQYVGDNIRFLKDSFGDMYALYRHYEKLICHCEEKAFAPEIVEDMKKANEEADIEFIMEEIPSAIEQSLDGVAKASSIVSAMKEFSHPGQKEKALGDINRILESTATVARNEWKYVADLKMELDEKLPLVKCLPEINQVFLNMIVNAAHAIAEKLGKSSSGKGLITIKTSHTEQFVEIRISDTGSGIPKEYLNKIYEPFFTTKEVGKGTGQGLAISHNIVVEQHHGTLEAESELNEGTTFIIRLPIVEEEAP